MELELIREHFPGGTNGTLSYKVAHTIELPWLDNKRRVSCISEGRYEVMKRYTEKHKDHLILMNVPGRDGILIHPANDAVRELMGCIAPVTALTGEGKGIQSKAANDRVKALVELAFSKGERVFLTVKTGG
jgi:hypothetical protein